MDWWFAIIAMLILGALTYLEARTVYRQVTQGVPYLFFSPHPAYRNRPPNKRSAFLWFSVFCHAWGVMVFALMTLLSGAFFLEDIGVIYS
jgi:hypothetical protein